MSKYIYQYKDWPNFQWDAAALVTLLGVVRQYQGRLIGRMETLGFNLRDEAILRTLTLDVVKSSEIENDILDINQVRSSIARKLGMDIGGLTNVDRHTEGVVEMMLDATQNYRKPLTESRLFDWHAALFPTSRSGMRKILVGSWRDDHEGPMEVVSGPIGRERTHFQAPEAKRIPSEMKKFLTWFGANQSMDPVLKAGIAHLWFVTIHPFEDGNGRIARSIADLQLARADGSKNRFYSMSAQIKQERDSYYEHLEQTQKGGLDITSWLGWFLTCLEHALHSTESTFNDVMKRANFWKKHGEDAFNARQRLILNKLFDDFFGNLTTTKWAKITKCSQDTAARDIQNLIDRGILIRNESGGRSTSYSFRE